VAANLIQVVGGRKAYGAREILRDATFSIDDNEHVGVIGPNGAGKTTLFKALVGEEKLDSGNVVRAGHLRLGYLAQHDTGSPDITVEDFVTGSPGAGLQVTMPIWDLKPLGYGLGLTDAIFARRMSDLSGGYRMRAKLLRLLGQEPNLMLLDEPTNYLDLETLLVLEDFLIGSKSAFLLISHDREFLRRTTDHILEVEGGETTKFPGSIDDYFEQKELLRAQLESRAMSLDARRREVLDFAARFGAKATKARQVQSRLKSLDRMETIELKPLPVQAKIRIPTPPRIPKLALEVRGGKAGYPGKTILSDVELQILGGDRIGVVGLNGAGKSTLLKSLAGEIPLVAGQVEKGFGVEIGAYGQHVAERLDPSKTVLEELESATDLSTSRQEVLDLAGCLLFSGSDTGKKVRVLSGGEKSRVALGKILLARSTCLLLDEPTNHLDFYTVEALTQALENYPGTVFVVSHDRGFIRRTATKILEIREGRARLYPGTYDEYVWSLQKGVLGRGSASDDAPAVKPSAPKAAAASVKASASSAPRRPRGEIERERRQLAKEIEREQRRLDEAQAKLEQINAELMAATPEGAQKLLQEMAQIQSRVQFAESRWLELVEKDEGLEKELTGA
jgi:ATP-binding cassette subfamily F protein 3